MIISLLIFLLNFSGIYLPAEAELKIEIQGVQNAKGNLGILLFNRKEGFPSDHTKALKQITVAARKGTNIVVFDHLAPGTYAVAVMHDENTNLKLDTNWVGMPTEGYGFSGNKMGLMGPPSFSDAAVSIGDAAAGMIINMRY